MGNRAMVENKVFTIGCGFFLAAIYALILTTWIFSPGNEITFPGISLLSLASLILFLLVVFLAAWRRSLFFLFLIFVLLAFPAPIDDLFPSVYLTNPNDRDQVLFPLFTRIDIYLIIGILLAFFNKPKRIEYFRLPLIIKIFILLAILVFIVNAVTSEDIWDFNLLLAYSFHLRYFLLLLFLLQVYDIRQYKKQIVYGFVLSMLFLLIEAVFNTYIGGFDRLLSGSLSLNTFANIAAAVAVYIIFLLKEKKISRLLGWFTLAIILAILVGSATRGAFITLILSYLLLNLFYNPRKLFLNLFRVSIGIALLLLSYLALSNYEMIPQRYSYDEISKRVEINPGKRHLNEIVVVQITRETSSIKSRIDLFDASISMMAEHPVTGIGAGRWNRYKNVYSHNKIIPKVLLDSHNDYLALFSQYGLPLGLLFAYIIFFYPLRLFKREMLLSAASLAILHTINFSMGIAAISNSGVFKHQVSAVLLFGLCALLKLSDEKD